MLFRSFLLRFVQFSPRSIGTFIISGSINYAFIKYLDWYEWQAFNISNISGRLALVEWIVICSSGTCGNTSFYEFTYILNQISIYRHNHRFTMLSRFLIMKLNSESKLRAYISVLNRFFSEAFKEFLLVWSKGRDCRCYMVCVSPIFLLFLLFFAIYAVLYHRFILEFRWE